jgi:hypothetical protein
MPKSLELIGKRINLRKAISNIWFFPTIVIFFLLLMTGLGINGSSVSLYNQFLNEKPQSLLLGTPQSIRSDQFVVDIPFTISQYNNNLPEVNEYVGEGQDMFMSGPVKNWAILFHPQHLLYLILPLDNAFAFSWWCGPALLMIGVYFLILALFPRQKKLAVLLAIFTFLQPFTRWWDQYQIIGYAAIIGSLLIYLLKSFRKNKLWQNIGVSLALFFFMSCFCFLWYPPFMIPCALIILVIVLTYYFTHFKWKYLFENKLWLFIVIPLVLAIVSFVIYYFQHQDALSIMMNTAYPGQRDSITGHKPLPVLYLLHWPIAWLSATTADEVFRLDICQYSQWIYVGLLTLPFTAFASIKNYIKNKSSNNKYVLVYSMVLILLCVFFSVYIFTDWATGLYRIFGFSMVTPRGAIIGLGLLNVLAVALPFVLWKNKRLSVKDIFTLRNVAIFLFVFSIISISVLITKIYYPLLPYGLKILLALSVFLAIATTMLLMKNPMCRLLSMCGLIIFCAFCTAGPTVIQQGLAPVTNNEITNAIRDINNDDPGSKWAVSVIAFANLPLTVNAKSVSGVRTYPQLSFWEEYFPNTDEYIYNRYQHLTYSFDENLSTREATSPQSDVVKVTLNSCDDMLANENVNYIITFSDQVLKCFSKHKDVGLSWSIFKRND